MTPHFKVTGMVGTLDGKFVPIETPDAEPWYKIAHVAVSDIMLTDGDRYCWKDDITDGDRYCWKDDITDGQYVVLTEFYLNGVRNAIKLYNKEIGV